MSAAPFSIQSGNVHHVTSQLITPIAPAITVIACCISPKTPNQLTPKITTQDMRVIAIVTGLSREIGFSR